MTAPSFYENAFCACLRDMAAIDYLARADTLGATVRDDGLWIPFFGVPYHVSPAGVCNESGGKPSPAVCLVLCRYVLLCPDETAGHDPWITFRELSGAGPLTGYFTANTNKTIEAEFSGGISRLKAACRRLAGRFVDEQGYSVSVVFDFLPRVRINFRFNDSEEGMPAQSAILFRQSAEKAVGKECLSIGGTYLTGKLIGG